MAGIAEPAQWVKAVEELEIACIPVIAYFEKIGEQLLANDFEQILAKLTDARGGKE